MLAKNFPQQQAIGRTWSWLSPADYHNGTIDNNNNNNNNNNNINNNKKNQQHK